MPASYDLHQLYIAPALAVAHPGDIVPMSVNLSNSGLQLPVIFSGTATNGSPTVYMSSTASLQEGQLVSGTGILSGTTILTVNNNASVILSKNFTGSPSNPVSLTASDHELISTADIRISYDATELSVNGNISGPDTSGDVSLGSLTTGKFNLTVSTNTFGVGTISIEIYNSSPVDVTALEPGSLVNINFLVLPTATVTAATSTKGTLVDLRANFGGSSPTATGVPPATDIVFVDYNNEMAFQYVNPLTNNSAPAPISPAGDTDPNDGHIVITNTTTTLTSAPSSSWTGETVHFTATVNPAGTNAPSPPATGTVTFNDNGTSIGTGGLSSGVATFTTNSLPVANHTITAVYGGNLVPGSFGGSTSNTITQTVQALITGSTSVTLTSTPAPDTTPTKFGQPVTVTATVTITVPKGTNALSGVVTFLDGGTSIGTAAVSGPSGSTATFATSASVPSPNGLTVGTHTIIAVYGSDTNYDGSNVVSLDADGGQGEYDNNGDVKL